MDNLTVISLPNGVKAYIKSSITRRDYKELMRIIGDATKVNPKTQDMTDVPLSVQLEMSDKALSLLLVKVELPDGKIAADPIKAVEEMGKADTDALYDAIDAMTADVFSAKKNSQ